MNQEFKNRMINKILEFCSDYPEVTRDKVRAPSQRDFIMIFELIYTTFDPKYTLENKKLGEEIPSLLRNWGYPIPIKPSTLLTVGAPTAWPHLLAMLGWMIDMASVHQKLSLESAFLESNNTDEFFKSMTYGLEARKFKQYSKDRQSADNDPNFFSDVKTIFAQQCEQSRGTAMQLEECKKNVKQLMEEIEAFKAEGDACRSLKDQKSQLEQDVTKCREYFMELESEVNGKRERCVLFDKVAREKEQELNAAKKKMQELEAAMTAQTTESGIDAATAREMRMEKQQNKTKLEQLTLGIEEVYKKKYALVIEAKKRFSAIQGPVKRRLQRVLQVRQELLGEHNQQELVGLQAEDARSLHEVVTEKGKRLIYKTRSDLETLALQIASSLKKVEAECRRTLEEIGVEKEREHCERREEDAREKLREKERLKWQRERALLERESDACRADINATLELQQDIGNMRNTIESARQDLEETVNRINREKAAVEGEVSDKMAEIILEWEESKRKLEMVEQETDRMFLSQDIE